ncbi:MAG: response regulator transcription factor [Prolixibacteraceae bacterium]|nr:response regulator transcription factor [Prolixibacteraceae bacterium]MBN2775956.1 response regulator transcription factor [Prolixibacteraceae bacterium]
MVKILIVEDEPAMLIGLRDNLEFEGYEVDTADKGDTGYRKLISGNYDLVLLDVMLPEMSGFDICRSARKKGIETPIIMLTARGEEMDRVLGLELGADDYITKPFSLRELSARIKTILRRTATGSEKKEENNYVQIGKLSISFEKFDAFDDNGPVKLSHKEFEILEHLLKNKNAVVTRDNLLDAVWGLDYQPTARTVDNFILRLRQKIDSEENQHIITVHGIGYKLVL